MWDLKARAKRLTSSQPVLAWGVSSSSGHSWSLRIIHDTRPIEIDMNNYSTAHATVDDTVQTCVR